MALEELSKRLLQLNDIPLKVSTVQPLDSGFLSLLKCCSYIYASRFYYCKSGLCLPLVTAFRMTSVFPPIPHPLAQEKGVDIKLRKPVSTCINPVEVMIQA